MRRERRGRGSMGTKETSSGFKGEEDEGESGFGVNDEGDSNREKNLSE